MTQTSKAAPAAADGRPARSGWLRGARTPAHISGGYSAYVIFMLTAVFTLSMADRNVMAILLQPIQEDLGVSDAAMGALTGSAFSIIYATAALPLARLADRSNRRNIIAAAVAIWSIATALCGLAATYLQMLFARIGVAAAESAATPSAMAIIGDLYSPARRGSAIAATLIGGGLGVALGSFVAGAVTEASHWKVAFFVLGIPGVLMAVIFWLTVPEPVRGAKDGGPRDDPDAASTLRSLRYLFSVPTVWRLLAGSILLYLTHAAWTLWTPTFFLRVHHLSLTEMSAWYGAIVGVSSILSMVMAGVVSDWLAKRGERWRLYYVCGALLIAIPCAAAATLAPDVRVAWVFVFLYLTAAGGTAPVVAAAGLGVVKPSMRAFMSSIKGFVLSAVAGGLGPLLIGALNDVFAVQFGQNALRYSLLAVPVLLAPSALAFYWSSLTTDRDSRRVIDAAA